MSKAKDRKAVIREMAQSLLECHADILDWVKFAERQLKEIPDCDHLPCGPTDAGIAQSKNVAERAIQTLRVYRKLTENVL